MSIQNLLNQFMGTTNTANHTGSRPQSIGSTFNNLSNSIPGGLAGGVAAGGIMALLVSSKPARKFAGKAATYGGAALLGGLAYKALQNWQQNNSRQTAVNSGTSQNIPTQEDSFTSAGTLSPDFQLTLIKAMIAAAKADGHIDATEQQRIFKAVKEMDVSTETKGVIFDLLRQPISVEELAAGAISMEQKSEVYLASSLVIDPDHPLEQAHLDQLAKALQLPHELAQQLQSQAQQAMAEAA
jgi:uncharacterized membrane protein YebE (DUF533 family)